MKYIFITFNGLCDPIAYKLMQEGHEVIVGIIEDIKDYVIEEEIPHAYEDDLSKKRRLQLYEGLINFKPANVVIEMMKNIKNPKEYFVFFEENNLYRFADKIRHLGFHGIFPTKEDYFYEVSRQKGKKFVKENYPKLHIPSVVEFTKVKDAITFLEGSSDIWVLKPNIDSAKTFVPDVTDIKLARKQIIQILKSYPSKYEKLGFILEQFIPSVIELTPEKMYYDGVPIATTMNFENKSIGAGNISVQTGCAEDLVFPTHMSDRINKIAFPPIVDEMAKAHRGLFIWDASILINRKNGKMYFGEFCANRPGYNSFFTELAQCSSVDAFFKDVVNKKNPFTIGTVASSVRIFNFNRDEQTQQLMPNITVDYPSDIEKQLWLWDIKKDNKGQLLSVGENWSFGVITGANRLIDDAVGKIYKALNELSFVGGYYRSKDDFLSLDYPTSILSRLNYGLERGLYELPFDVKVGEIKGIK